MADKFANETSRQNYEWHRERALREKKEPKAESMNRMVYNLKAIEKKHGVKAANELMKELSSKRHK